MADIYSFAGSYADGVRSSAVIEPLLGINHEVSLEALALLFSAPAFFGDFMPHPPWKGIYYTGSLYDHSAISSFRSGSDARVLRAAFHQSVDAAIGEASTVAVALSGGIDSAAVLCAAHSIAYERGLELIAVTTELISDNGLSNRDTAELICRAISPNIRFMICSGYTAPRWDMRGPCLHALPWSTSHQIELVQQAGAEVLLTGSGSDELIGTPRYLLSHLARGSLIAYIATALENGWYGAVAESACLLARWLNRKHSVKLYMACNYIATRDIIPSKVLGKHMRSYVEMWEAAYMRDLFHRHERVGASWTELDAFDTLYPLQLTIPSNTIIRTEAPFLAEPFFSQALNTRLTARFNASERDSYRQRKSIAAGLVKPEVLAHISQQKATFRKSIKGQRIPDLSDPLMVVESGLIDPDEIGMVENAEIVPTILAVERWLRGARDRGFRVGCV